MLRVQNEFAHLADELVLEVMRRIPSLYDRWNMMSCCARFVTIHSTFGAACLLDDLTKAQREKNALFAAIHGHDLLLNALLMAGVGSQTIYGERVTLLMVAAINGHLLCVRVLLMAGSDVEACGCQADLEFCREMYHRLRDRPPILEVQNSPVGIIEHEGYVTALMAASGCGRDSCVTALLEAGSDPNRAPGVGSLDYTALTHASWNGHNLCVRALISNGSHVDKADKLDNTPLMFAAYRGNDACLRELLSAGADPNTVGYFGETALTLAAVRGHEHCLIALIDAGSDVNRETNSGATALKKAFEGQSRGRAGGDVCVAALLVAAGRLDIACKDFPAGMERYKMLRLSF